jgi:hypothetical protein
VVLSGGAASAAHDRGITGWRLSNSHAGGMAVAIALRDTAQAALRRAQIVDAARVEVDRDPPAAAVDGAPDLEQLCRTLFVLDINLEPRWYRPHRLDRTREFQFRPEPQVKYAIYSNAPPKSVPDETTIQTIIAETRLPVVSESARAALAEDLGRIGRHVELFHLFERRTAAIKKQAKERTKQLETMLALPQAGAVALSTVSCARERRWMAATRVRLGARAPGQRSWRAAFLRGIDQDLL